jgi:serine/threonine-protein kinase
MSWGLPTRKSGQDSALELLRQETLGEYEILDELGRGGMATVYLAHDIALDRRVAIKVMSTALPDEGLAERFRREARTAASLNHPHIIPIYAVRERSPLLYFVMKFVAGQSLDPIMKKSGGLPIPLARVVLAQAASALGYAHRRGVIHRDVKPANIMLDDDGWVVVTDFGIAKVPSATGLTLTGVTVGTPAYMSPEQCMGKEVTGASDQYSLGVVAYEMLTGRKLFTASTAMAMMYAHFHEEPKPLREVRPEIPEDLEAVVLRMLQKEPENRWPKIDEAFTAPALQHDDPITQHLISLATEGGLGARSAQISTPTSPIPPARRSTLRATPVSTTTPVVPPALPPGTLPPGTEARASMAAPTEAAPAAPIGSPAVRERSSTTARPSTVSTPSGPARRVWLGWALGALLVAVAVPLVVRSARKDHPGPAAPTSPRDTTSNSAAGDTNKLPQAGAPVDSGKQAGRQVTGGNPPASTGEGARSADTAVARIQIAGVNGPLDVNQTASLTAQLATSSGSPVRRKVPVAWGSSAPSVVRVDQRGSAKALSPGRATISATADGKSGSLDVVVRAPAASAPVAVAEVAITPATLTLQSGQSRTLSAEARDAKGTALPGQQLIWASSDSTVVSVSGTGQATGRTPGSAVVTAIAAGRVGRVSITVTPPSVAGVTVPAPPALKPGGTFQLTATVRDSQGAALANRKIVWSTSDPKVVTVAEGLLTAHEPGSATVTASVEGRSVSAPVTVTAPPADPAAEHTRATQETTRLLDAFVEALNQRDLGRLKAVYPGMPAAVEARWRTLLEDPRLNKLQATRDPLPALRLDQDGASAPFTVHLRPSYSGVAASPVTLRYQAVFQQEGGKWQLRSLDEQK